MPGRRNLISFSKVFLIAVSAIYFALSIADSALAHALDLRPALFHNTYQYWRILTFAFVPGSVASYLLFLVAFYIFSPKIEGVFRRNVFPLFLLLLIAFQGIGLSIVFWNKNAVFSGMDGLSIFLISFFTLLYPGSKVLFANTIRVRTVWVSTAIMLLWFSSAAAKAVFSPGVAQYASIAYASFGFVLAFVLFVQISIIKKIRSRRSYKQIVITREEAQLLLEPAPVERRKLNEAPAQPSLHILDSPEENEIILNEILDKISSTGKESLSLEEKKFLEDYSKQL